VSHASRGRYVEPYKELLYRKEQSSHLEVMILGLASDLERISVEPIAVRGGQHRRPLQAFVGISQRDHGPLRRRVLEEVAAEIGVADGDLILDGCGVPKKGRATVGVKRQYCGRLGKVDNCVIGVHAVYVGKDQLGALVESQLYLPSDWLAVEANRIRTHVPTDVMYRTQPAIALDQITALAASPLPFQWVHGDDEFGRCQAIRDRVRQLGRWFCFDVPADTLIVATRNGTSVRRVEQRVSTWVNKFRTHDWVTLDAKNGEKGCTRLRVLSCLVFTKRPDGISCRERLLVLENEDGSDRRYLLCHAPESMALVQLVQRALRRHIIEEVFQQCKGEVGMDHFEVRSWHGWHHHMTPELLTSQRTSDVNHTVTTTISIA
jgi:SRSO17 transposase